MNQSFDYNGHVVSPSKPVKTLRIVKKTLHIDSEDRDTGKYALNGDMVIHLPRTYKNVVSIRLVSAQFPDISSAKAKKYSSTSIDDPITGNPSYIFIDLEGLNKSDETALNANRSTYIDGTFAKIYINEGGAPTTYNDNIAQENISKYSPPIENLDRFHITTRLHSQQDKSGFIFWANGSYSLTFEVEYLENGFDDFSSFETRLSDRRF